MKRAVKRLFSGAASVTLSGWLIPLPFKTKRDAQAVTDRIRSGFLRKHFLKLWKRSTKVLPLKESTEHHGTALNVSAVPTDGIGNQQQKAF